MEHVRDVDYTVQLATDGKYLAFDSDCSKHSEALAGYSGVSDLTLKIAIFACAYGEGTLTATLEASRAGHPDSTSTAEARTTIPDPLPAVRLRDLPEQHSSGDCPVLAGSGAVDGDEGVLNDVGYSIKSAVGIGFSFGNMISNLLLSEYAGLHCFYVIASHLPPTKGSSIAGSIEVEVGRKFAYAEAEFTDALPFSARCNSENSICQWESELYLAPRLDISFTIRAPTYHNFYTHGGYPEEIATFFTDACFRSDMTLFRCKE